MAGKQSIVTKFRQYGSKRLIKKDIPIICIGKTIGNQNSIKYLGIMLDQNLLGEAIANNV